MKLDINNMLVVGTAVLASSASAIALPSVADARAGGHGGHAGSGHVAGGHGGGHRGGRGYAGYNGG